VNPVKGEISMAQDRYQKGWEKLKEIDGEAGAKLLRASRIFVRI
jgi:hypothetical protein